MKQIVSLLTVAACAVIMPTASQAAEKKKPAAEAAADSAKKPAAEAAAPAKTAGEAKPLPMNSRADVIDAKTKTFTMNRKDGVAVKHVVSDTTEIKNGEAAAKFEDIKVGDYVSGLRQKVSDTEYSVVKITKFGPKGPSAKKDGEAKAGGEKAEGKKGN